MSLPLTANVYETPDTESKEVAIACRTVGETGAPVAALPGVPVGGGLIIDMPVPAVVGDVLMAVAEACGDMLMPAPVVGDGVAATEVSRATHPARTRTEVATSPLRASRRAPPNRATSPPPFRPAKVASTTDLTPAPLG
jgi:hypothetical protein